MAVWILTLAAAVLSAASLALTVQIYRKLCRPSRAERTDQAVEAAQSEAIASQPDPIDEGFENIMTFSVRGKTGFETQ